MPLPNLGLFFFFSFRRRNTTRASCFVLTFRLLPVSVALVQIHDAVLLASLF